MSRIYLVLTWFIISTAFLSCEKDKNKSNIYLSLNEIEFDYDENYASFKMSNIGSEDFTWNASAESDFIFFTESTGQCKKNNFVEIGVNINRSEITGDSISTSIIISNDKGSDQTIEVFVLNFPEEKIRLGFRVMDAQYDYKNDQLVMIPYYNENFVAVFDLSTLLVHRVEVQDQPRHLTIMPQGGTAVVSYQDDGAISINTITKKLMNTFSMSNDYYSDIIGAPGNLVYFFPNYSNGSLGLLNISNESFSLLNSGYSIAYATLHPSGKYIYSTDYANLTKFNIENLQPEEEYSTYQYNTDNKLWLSKDGKHIFTRSKLALRIDPTISGMDIIESETIELDGIFLHYIEQNENKNEYYAIPSNYSSSSSGSEREEIHILDQNFNLIHIVELEDYMYKLNNYPGYQTSPPSAEYVFCSSDGIQIIVITQGSSQYQGDTWGIEIINR